MSVVMRSHGPVARTEYGASTRSRSATHLGISNMLGEEEDVFDSVTWETPAHNPYDAQATEASMPARPGFRQSNADDERGPHEPKWEGYLITQVKDPQKELPETKDTYVSYLVTAKVRAPVSTDMARGLITWIDQPAYILHTQSFITKALSGFRLSTNTSCEGLSSMCRPSAAGQAPDGYVQRLAPCA